jgi:hypothetical protein
MMKCLFKMKESLEIKRYINTLKEQYDEAIAAGEDRFIHMGMPLMVSYTKYLIEHLENMLKEALKKEENGS